MNKTNIIYIILSVIIIALGTIFTLQYLDLQDTQQELGAITAEMEFDKQQSIEEFEELAQEYEGFYIETSNDSLILLIDDQKNKIQQLLLELKTVKATNSRRITQLKKELGTVRNVLKTYIEKVDSLNTVNQDLQKENTKVKNQYVQASKNAKKLEDKTIELDKQIVLASIMEAGNINVKTLSEKGRKTSSLRRIASLEICFQIMRNITADRGLRNVYIRISNPTEELLGIPGQHTFPFEGSNIDYSAKKEVEYGGQTLPVCMYYHIQDKLIKGVYTITVFTDGNIIGTQRFLLD